MPKARSMYGKRKAEDDETIVMKTTKYKKLNSGKRMPITVVPKALARTSGFPGPMYRTGQEHKFFDDTGTNVFAGGGEGGAPLITAINKIDAGADMDQRIGREINIRSVQLRAHVYMPAFNPTTGSTIPSCMCRIMLMYDRQTNGTLPAITTILQTSSPLSFHNLTNNERFLTLLDEHFVLGPKQFFENAAATEPVCVYSAGKDATTLVRYKKCALRTTYSGTEDTIGAIATGSLLLVAVCDSGSVAESPTMEWQTRIRFTEN